MAEYAISGRAAIASASAGSSLGRIRTSRGRASGFTGVDEKNRSTRIVVGPTTSIVLMICPRMPFTMEAMAMTVDTPITTPRIVRPERSLFARMASRAMPTPSAREVRRMETTGRRPAGDADSVRPSARGYSYRSATIGSSRAARVAGYTPNTMPTAAPRARARSADHGVTTAGRGESAWTRLASVNPAARPSAPPMVVSVTRNWWRMSRFRAPE
jgi:hypothetical protein